MPGTTGNLAPLVQQLKAIGTTPAPAGAPLEALRAYWAGDMRGAVDKASALLADDPDTPHRFMAYRLWIEALAEGRDVNGLAALRDHLFLRGQADPADQATYAALRGVVHLELDEFGAAKLLARACRELTADPYGLELVQRVEARGAESEDEKQGSGIQRCDFRDRCIRLRFCRRKPRGMCVERAAARSPDLHPARCRRAGHLRGTKAAFGLWLDGRWPAYLAPAL